MKYKAKAVRQQRVSGHSYPRDKGGKGGYISYNKALKQKARENRKNPTSAEKKFWYEVLGNKRLDNLKFTRQNQGDFERKYVSPKVLKDEDDEA